MLLNLKLLRKEAGISQAKLAEAVGVTQESINQYENHAVEPDIDLLIRMADYFHTSVDYLVGHTSIRQPIEFAQINPLTPGEAQILLSFRHLTPDQQRGLSSFLEVMRTP